MMNRRFIFDLLRWMLFLVPLAIAAGCTANVQLPDQSFADPPLISQTKAAVGIYVSGTVRTQTFISPLLRINFGKISAARFNQIFRLMFADVFQVPDWPPWYEAGLDADAVIELKTADVDITLGNDLNMPDALSVSYRICLYRTNRTIVSCWDTGSSKTHQRRPFECLDLSACFEQYLNEAVRDAAAKFLLTFENDPAVRDWANRLAQPVSIY